MRKPADAGQGKPVRADVMESEVAKLFDNIRADLKTSKLGRIRNRDSLEQTVCTAAVTGTLPKFPLRDEFALYETSDPDSVSNELNHVASFDSLHPRNKAGYRRYSIAVWRMKDSKTGDNVYWVGVQLFWNAAVEFFDYHFTDDVEYHNEWKKTVAPECRPQ